MGATNLANVKRPSSTNAGGYTQNIYLAPKSWIDTYSAPAGPAASPGEEVTNTTAFTFVSAASLGWLTGTPGFLKFESTYDVNTLKTETNMNRHASGDKITFESLLSGMDKDLIGTLKNASFDDWVVLVQDSNDAGTNKFIQIGSNDFPAMVKGVFDGGTANVDARKGFKITVEAFGLSITKHEPVAAPVLYDPLNP